MFKGRLADDLGCSCVQLGWILKGVERSRGWNFPLKPLSAFPRFLGCFFSLTQHGWQHDKKEKVKR